METNTPVPASQASCSRFGVRQTKSARQKEIGVCKIATKALQVTALSVRDKYLAKSLVPALLAADRMTNMKPMLTTANPGRIITKAPIIPTPRAIQRRRRIFSPRNNIAPTVTKSGPINPKATASARGTKDNAVYQVINAPALKQARTIWSGSLVVLSGVKPILKNHGI